MYVLSQILYIFLEIEEITKNIYGWVYIGHHDSIFWQKHQVLGEIFIIYLLYISTVHLGTLLYDQFCQLWVIVIAGMIQWVKNGKIVK